MHQHKQHGFTLIELAITLVIIGLLVGGVMVGQDLIKSAEIRATVSQIEKYNTVVHTFQTKYNGIPGDLLSTQAQDFGFFSNGMDGTTGKGDGNGLVQDRFGHSTINTQIPFDESMVFWRHLSDANLIDGNYGAGLIAGGWLPSTQAASKNSQWIPPSKLNGNIVVYSAYGQNFYQILSFVDDINWFGAFNSNNLFFSPAPSITPIEAQSIDTKMDDGLPTSGLVKSVSGKNGYYLGKPSVPSDNCTISSSTPNSYDTGKTNGTSRNCALSFKFQ